ncbi:DUF2785 domain-containing protein [Lysobacter arenosi]|uniref:DUF2785 domain-containing protein n=1 Tax=Lysobacter arenosi TaxID=2795387 RepID=A0ABX7RE35_9GAMM|nr:DUF2785 domain-containing protein [Lysobacter arenosi]QSX76430.1 DUF2785 domain-containing protein [Lysobacter arenosi]
MRTMVLALTLLLASTPAMAGTCPPDGWSVEKLQALKHSQFVVADPGERASLALALLDCLGETNPQVRDGIAYEGLAAWMRKGELAPETLRPMRERLYAMLSEPDPDGVRWPFAALVLAEVARTDRTTPWMTPAERATIVVRAATYFTSVRDYRGFEADVGWRHGVAHGADWLMQLSLNPALDGPQLNRIVDAIAVQVVPASGHAYIFGEPQRMAAPLVYAAQRGVRDEAAWTAWFAAMLPRLGDPALAWRDSAWLGRRHDLSAFLEAVYVEADLSTDPRVKTLLPGVTAALKALP